MTNARIQQAIEGIAQFFSEHPEKGRVVDKSAVATIQDGLMCRAEGPHGAVLVSDMPRAPAAVVPRLRPLFLRAALANCDATVIAMRAAQLGVLLTKLEVSVDSVSDDRGMFGLGDGIPRDPKACESALSLLPMDPARAASADRRMGRSSLAGRRCDPQSHSVERGDPDRLARRRAPTAASSSAAAASRTRARSGRRSPAGRRTAPRR